MLELRHGRGGQEEGAQHLNACRAWVYYICAKRGDRYFPGCGDQNQVQSNEEEEAVHVMVISKVSIFVVIQSLQGCMGRYEILSACVPSGRVRARLVKA